MIMLSPPKKNDYVLAVIVNFLNHEAEKSERPESLLKSLSSALKHWLKAHDLQVHHELLDNFMKALIRINTIRPKGRTKILPIQLFMSMFRDWGHNDLLTLGRLRQKAITLLAFAAMCRPSDIAPTCGFKRKQLLFKKDGSMVIQFFGTKTDSNRTGHEVLIKRGTEDIIDPVKTMKDYLSRTQPLVDADGDSPVFLSLHAPYSALSAAAVADTLNKCIKEAGLDDSGFTARSFRPTGATAYYVTSGVEHHITRTLGRWKSEECFNGRYVYPLSAVSATDKMLNVSLPM